MYEQLDVAWVALRPGALVYLYMRSKNAYVAQLGPCVPQLGPSRPFFGPTRRPRGFPGRFWRDVGPLREALDGQKHNKI